MRWQELALCAQVDPELWFPEKGASAKPAKRICARCPVQFPCAQAGRDEEHGIWGGTSREQRRQDKREAA